ncbi:HAD family hydrolase [Notoacmeibacter sp. MSK16QG-6]|uniref:HAD family hydrolase n=1 Tax=Notoacmeibacter sp. MSK16QG-6 TaxID=2957982 RepID=UPI00209CFCB6|nr:HAD family hydrolase [Notoacmeibacter sp. MSK16QG-6]MCP1198393.1 HAD family hydrolase [Notoacmeibacter sp. MSK16QG-6]
MSVEALIFDVDGTLAETEEAHRQAFNAIFEQYGLDWHWSIHDYTRLLEVTGGKERMRHFRDINGRSEPDDAEIRLMHSQKTDRYAAILSKGALPLRAGVKTLIEKARNAGLKTAIATTTSGANVEALCQCCWGLPAGEIFDAVAAGDEVEAKKPAPDVYLLVLSRLGLSADKAIAFEDSENGLRSAKAAGLRTVVTPSAFTSHQDFSSADWVVSSLGAQNLPPLLSL